MAASEMCRGSARPHFFDRFNITVPPFEEEAAYQRNLAAEMFSGEELEKKLAKIEEDLKYRYRLGSLVMDDKFEMARRAGGRTPGLRDTLRGPLVIDLDLGPPAYDEQTIPQKIDEELEKITPEMRKTQTWLTGYKGSNSYVATVFWEGKSIFSPENKAVYSRGRLRKKYNELREEIERDQAQQRVAADVAPPSLTPDPVDAFFSNVIAKDITEGAVGL
tara:strand:- start:8110 stop:8766 length:657 start_codon:yes stop_codon:yes gene_type:complete